MQELDRRILLMAQTVREQLTDALAAFNGHDPKAAELVIERDDVVDTVRSSLEESCFHTVRKQAPIVEERRARGALRVIYNLERIGDAASHIAKHCLMLASEGDDRVPLPLEDMATIALASVDESVRSFVESDLQLAERACEREPELDALYIQRIEKVADLIDAGKIHGRTALHVLATLKYLEKVCDFSLNIGETTVFALTGARLSYPQFRELRSLLPGETPSGSVHRHFWDGISGATVVEVGGPNGEHMVFKEGSTEKIRDEFHKTIEWEAIAPEHTARVIGIAHGKGRAGILREFAEGTLLLDLLLSDGNLEAKESAMLQVTDVLTDIWRTTITPRPAPIDYVSQIRTRLRDAFRRHPHLERIAREELQDLGGLYDLLTLLAAREPWLRPPFSIWIHGDLTAGNIVIDSGAKSVVFIDVHRSRYGDYLQDVAVLATSSVRKFPRAKVAKGVRRGNELLFEVAEEFARANGDRCVKERLRLARARALITSARLESDPARAQALFIEGLQMLRKVAKYLKVGKKD